MPEEAARAAEPVGGAEFPPIKGFLETSFLDWPGKIAAVFFLPGCNFRCPYCHNFALVERPQGYLTLPWEEVRDRLRPFVGWIDGVVVTGGEPTLHAGLAGLLAAIKAAGFGVKLDSNGGRPEVLEDLAARGLLDAVAMDVKAPLEPLAYARAAGGAVDLAAVRRSIAFLKASGLPHEFRTTVWPAWHGREELMAMARELAGGARWTLQALNPKNAWRPEALGQGVPYRGEEVARLQAEIADRIGRGGAG